MTHDQVCTLLLSLGGKEYPDLNCEVRAFAFPRVDGPDCTCNDKPPELHIRCFPDFHSGGNTYPGGVEVHVTGEAGNVWMDANFYSINREDVGPMLPRLRVMAAAVWGAFVGAANA